ncbi:MAG TPA: response regulator [Kofleriaceae bacterium]|nr:response regulator [Kofleriaceae bacterium]
MSAPRVLVVDDDPDLREALSDVLTDEGYQVDCAADGLEGLEHLRTGERPCLILLDWMMPRCDGPQFCAAQRADPAIADIPVVVLTAEMRLPHTLSALPTADYLKKPVELSRLLEVVRRHCG